MNKINIVDLLMKWEDLDQRDRMWKVFWPIMSNTDKQLYYIKRHNMHIIGNVDEMISYWGKVV